MAAPLRAFKTVLVAQGLQLQFGCRLVLDGRYCICVCLRATQKVHSTSVINVYAGSFVPAVHPKVLCLTDI